MDPNLSDSLGYSLSQLSTPVPERSRSRFSNRSFLQRTQDSISPSSRRVSPWPPSRRNGSRVAVADTLIYSTTDCGTGLLRRSVNASANPGATDVTLFTAAALGSEHPAVSATAGIYAEFMEAYHSYASEHDILDLLDKYEALCEKYLAKLKKVAERMLSRTGDAVWQETQSCLTLLTEERNTWQLTKVLLRDQLESVEQLDDEEQMTVDGVGGKETSDRQIVDALYAKDALIRRAQLVVDWLERCAALDHESEDRVEYFADVGGCAWENTLYRLQSQGDGGVPNCVSQLDPDAPSRLQQPLHDEDREDECRLFRNVFCHLRKGQLQRAQELAMENGHHWLAAALEGWKAHHDPNYGGLLNGASSLQPAEGNPYRDLWKEAAWDAVSGPNCSVYERAVYAALCGNLKGLVPVCHKWKDLLWAHMRLLVDVGIEQELRTATEQSRSLEPLPPGYPNQRRTLQEVFRDLQATLGFARQKELGLEYVVQRCVILNDVRGMAEEMKEWLANEERRVNVPMQTVRFAAHMVLLARRVGGSQAPSREACDAVVRCYVSQLVSEGRAELVATYAATLPTADQVSSYVRLLKDMPEDDPEQRELCLTLAREAGLNVPLITRTLVEQVRLADDDFAAPEEASARLRSPDVTPEDLRKVASLDWLLFDPSTRGEALKQANALMRGFVCLGKVAAAREAFRRLPSDSVDVVSAQWPRTTEGRSAAADDENAVREFFCFQALLQAHQSFQDWFEQFHRHKPAPPEEVAPGARFSEKVAHEHRVRSHQLELQQWRGTVSTLAREVEKDVYNVLLFVDGGWMVDQREQADDARRRQMEALRRLCIPQLTFLLHEALLESGLAADCPRLLDVVASEKQGLYREFGHEELQTLLRRSKGVSLPLLDEGLDALGYPLE
ncbi:nuclear pore complex protein Nup107 [Ixodes scapularis]|uniref:nuclear pore complex protein Nup107 n=1 Tax=Ixodes scapularis TaxID=6945 RepID=UPI001A9F8A45|nr:nuclear pore complex protein Nup107 [Ixodes scapularis]